MQTFVKKKVSIIILVTIIVLIIILSSSFFIYTEVKNNPKYYTYAEHLQNVTELMNKRMDMLNISDYEIAPVYNANEELFAFVIDYREGHIYVQVYNPSFVLKLFRVSMYTHAESKCFRFIDYEKNNSTIKWQKTKNISLLKDFPNRFWEIDEEGQPIRYSNSHFYVSNIANEKKYLLEVVYAGQLNYIPAVKRGDKYLNLISMDEFNLDDEKSLIKQSTCHLGFITKVNF